MRVELNTPTQEVGVADPPPTSVFLASPGEGLATMGRCRPHVPRLAVVLFITGIGFDKSQGGLLVMLIEPLQCMPLQARCQPSQCARQAGAQQSPSALSWVEQSQSQQTMNQNSLLRSNVNSKFKQHPKKFRNVRKIPKKSQQSRQQKTPGCRICKDRSRGPKTLLMFAPRVNPSSPKEAQK